MKVVKNDNVVVISGNYKGKKGKVLKVFPKQKNQQGGIVEKEAPIQASNLMVICPKCDTPTRLGRKMLESKKHIRVCKNCGEMLVGSS
jgi:large subunit ribosomal protein L24